MRLLFLFLFCLLFFSTPAQNVVVVEEGADRQSIATEVYYLEFEEGTIGIEDFRETEYNLKRLPKEKTDFSFTNADFWLKLRLYPKEKQNEPFVRYLEVARPVTNRAVLYHPHSDGSYFERQSGDGIPASLRQVFHRKTVFRIVLEPGQVSTFYLKVGSDGEALNLPVVLHAPEAFRQQDFFEQYFLGIYYGILLFVALIYFFFYARLGEKSFLFYVLYVIFVFVLQFSLDGFSSLILFPASPWMGNKSVLLSAIFSVYFLVRYVRSFLKTSERLPGINLVLKVTGWLTLVFIPLVLSSGILYRISYPGVNLLSLISLITIIVAIVKLKARRQSVDPFFSIAIFFLAAGATVFILNNIGALPHSFFSEFGIKIGTGLEVIFLSFSMANKFRELQKEKEKAQAATLEKLEEMNRLKDDINRQLEVQVKERTKEIQLQKEIIEEKNKDITDSIRYGQRIQEAILPDPFPATRFVEEMFILFQPKDIVSGDFYWLSIKDNKLLIAAADCTGHGVPGAFMSMIGNSFLNQIVIENNITEPSLILEELRKRVIQAMSSREEKATKDGMDIALLQIDKSQGTVKFSGAQNPLYILSDGIITEVKGTKCPVGTFHSDELPVFEQHEFTVQNGSMLYIFSDGYADQFGGEKGKKFKYSRLKEILLRVNNQTAEAQKAELEKEFNSWKGSLEQVDDVLLIGIRL